MGTNDQKDYSRLRLALAQINTGNYQLPTDFPEATEEYTISYDYKDYAKIVIQPDGTIIVHPLRTYVVHEEQLHLVLDIVEKILNQNVL